LENLGRAPNVGVVLLGDAFTRLHYPLIGELAQRLRIPSISGGPNLASSGGLMDYGPSNEALSSGKPPPM
jgi:hypothetical protein